MKILLINPGYWDLYKKNVTMESILPPLHMLYLTSVAEQHGHTVEALDMHAVQMTPDEVVKRAKDKDLVGLYCTVATAYNVYALAKMIKEKVGDIPIVVGGPHPSVFPQEPVETGVIDFSVIGEGEDTFIELIDVLEREKDVGNVHGICFRDNGEYKLTPQRKLIEDLDRIPFPAYHHTDVKKFFYPYREKLPIVSIMSSRGCTFGCTFCNKSVFGRTIRFRSHDNFIEEMTRMVDDFKVREFIICDDIFTVNKKRAIQICNTIADQGWDISLSCVNGLRVDSINDEVLAALKKAGCYLIAYGIESGNQKVLDSVKKGIKLDQVRVAVKKTKEHGITALGNFIIGFPEDTEETIKDTIKFAKLCTIAKFNILTPYPGTEIFAQLEAEGRIKTYDWSHYIHHGKMVFDHPNLSEERLAELYKRAYREVYINPRMILQELFAIRNRTRLESAIKVLRGVIFSKGEI